MTTKTDKTIIGFLGDESGSMGGSQRAMVDGFNEFVGNIRKDADGKDVKLVLGFFDASGHDPVLRIKLDSELAKCRELNLDDYSPRGGTPLNDATVEMIGKMDHDRAGDEKMMLVIFTDGLENSSRENTADDVRNLIQKKESDGWEFIYLGANHDVWAEGGQRGLAHNRTYQTSSSPAGVSASMGAVSDLASARVQHDDAAYAAIADETHSKTGGKIDEDS